MGTIRIEFVSIKKFYLGLLGFDHLQIVYEDEKSFVNKQDDWFVLEGTHEGGLIGGELGVLGEEFTTELSAANAAHGDALVGLIGTPQSRGSRIVYQGIDALGKWNEMMAYGREIQANDFPYEGLSWPFSPGAIMNSSSVVASLLNVIGIDVNLNMPFGVHLSPGTSTLLGTTQDDDITLKNNFTQVAGGYGSDTLRGRETTIFPEKFFGGDDDDTIMWSKGPNIIHGGQPRLAYAMDGNDTVDYSGVGFVRIVTGKYPIEHKVADFTATFEGGSDQLFSIEGINWYRETDVIEMGQGVDLLETPIRLELNESSDPRGDELGLGDALTPLIVNWVNDDLISIQTEANEGLDAGYWAESVEWLRGGAMDDRIYAGTTLKGIEGGKGNDLLDGREAQPFSRNSPEDYDIELYGGEGNDTIVSGTGYSMAAGGEGADRFVLSAMTSSAGGKTEFIIADADESDSLYVPYDLFKEVRGGFEGSRLMQIRGAPFQLNDDFPVSYFYWGAPSDDQYHGNIDFAGLIAYTKEGNDLIITLMQGIVDEYRSDHGGDEPSGPLIRRVVGDGSTETVIRVVDWQDGDLGLSFPLVFDPEKFATSEGEFYPGIEDVIDDMVNDSIFIDALEMRPDGYIPQDLKSPSAGQTARTFSIAAAMNVGGPTEGDDIIERPADGPYKIFALGGNDRISGSDGGDVIDGGTGDDTMAGGRGNDVYFVDAVGDVIIEETRGGFDRVYSTIDYVLPDEVEHLTLLGDAIAGTGNVLRNRLTGNDRDNILRGGGGNDTLAGNGGNDTLEGGAGADGYVYELGDGDDVIIEVADNDGGDVLFFAGQMSAADFTFIRSPFALDDLVLQFIDGGSVTIVGYFAQPGTIDGIAFQSGLEWSTQTLRTFADAALLTANRAPVAQDDAFVYAGANAFRLPVAALLDNDRDADGDALTVKAIAGVQTGNAVLDGSDIVVTAGTAGSASAVFTYVVSDTAGATATATASISFWPNSAPVISSSELGIVRRGETAAGLIHVSDADNDSLLFAVKPGAGPAKGHVTFGGDGHFAYTPDADSLGADSFTVLVTDPFGASDEATLTFDIAGPSNRAPQVLSARLDPVIEDHASDGLIEAADPDGDNITFAVKSGTGPTKGTLTLAANGAFTYAPAANANGPDTFTLLLRDSLGASTEQVFQFDIAAVNDAPVAAADRGFHVAAGSSLVISAATLLSNDADADGDTLSIADVTALAGGSASIDASGNVVFKSAPAFSGQASLTYLVSDGHGGSGTATIAIDVQRRESGHTFIGTDGPDRLVGTNEDDTFIGKKSADTLIGKGGNDTFKINGDAGLDQIDGGGGYDRLLGGDGDDTIRVTSRFANLKSVEEIDGGRGRDTLLGTSQADILDLTTMKIKNVEVISLGAGDDWVKDTQLDQAYFGGAGNDTFRFGRFGGHDVIADFSTPYNGVKQGFDKLDLTEWHFSSIYSLMAATHQEGRDLVIELDKNTTITLKNTTIWNIHYGQLIF